MPTYKNITSRCSTHFVPIPCHAIVRQGGGGPIHSLVSFRWLVWAQ